MRNVLLAAVHPPMVVFYSILTQTNDFRMEYSVRCGLLGISPSAHDSSQNQRRTELNRNREVRLRPRVLVPCARCLVTDEGSSRQQTYFDNSDWLTPTLENTKYYFVLHCCAKMAIKIGRVEPTSRQITMLEAPFGRLVIR